MDRSNKLDLNQIINHNHSLSCLQVTLGMGREIFTSLVDSCMVKSCEMAFGHSSSPPGFNQHHLTPKKKTIITRDKLTEKNQIIRGSQTSS